MSICPCCCMMLRCALTQLLPMKDRVLRLLQGLSMGVWALVHWELGEDHGGDK